MLINPGTRIGYWNPNPAGFQEKWKNAFNPVGFYVGPGMGDLILGTHLKQKLMEGDLEFSVGVLFRPDRNPRQRLETILILYNFVPEMFQYDDWEQINMSGQAGGV